MSLFLAAEAGRSHRGGEGEGGCRATSSTFPRLYEISAARASPQLGMNLGTRTPVRRYGSAKTRLLAPKGWSGARIFGAETNHDAIPGSRRLARAGGIRAGELAGRRPARGRRRGARSLSRRSAESARQAPLGRDRRAAGR